MKNIFFKNMVIASLLLIYSWDAQSQSSFGKRLPIYYNCETNNIDSLIYEIVNDTVIKKYGNYPELIDCLGSTNALYNDTLVSYIIIQHLITYRKVAKLTDSEKNEILTFLSDLVLAKIKNETEINKHCNAYYLFNWELWQAIGNSIKYNRRLIENLKNIIEIKPDILESYSVGRFTNYGLNELYPYVINYAIKPYFENTTNATTGRKIWGHIYSLAKVNNQEVLPYLYKALSESGCDINYSMGKYTNAKELTYIIKDSNIKKNIYINLLKDDCITKLIIPTIDRDDTSNRTYFDAVLDDLKMQYNNFPIEAVQKLSEKKQVEFVEKWIRKNM
jgi:hypothetical protein